MGILTTLYFFGGCTVWHAKAKTHHMFQTFFLRAPTDTFFFRLAKVARDVFKGWSPKNWTSAYILRLPCKTLGSSEWGQCNCHQPCYMVEPVNHRGCYLTHLKKVQCRERDCFASFETLQAVSPVSSSGLPTFQAWLGTARDCRLPTAIEKTQASTSVHRGCSASYSLSLTFRKPAQASRKPVLVSWHVAGRSFHLQTHWLAAALAATWRHGQTPLNQLRAPHRFALLGFWLMVRSWTTEPLLESLESPKLIRLCHLCLRDRFASEQGLQQPVSFQFHHSMGLSPALLLAQTCNSWSYSSCSWYRSHVQIPWFPPLLA